ncbi:MAG: hypothetical protein ACI9CE_000095 [Flavobacterium sp.]|jgi:hypothetical protein
MQHFSLEMNQLILACEGDLQNYVSSQESRFGMTQSEAGVLMAKRWVLPDMVSTVMQHSFNSDYKGDHWQVCTIVGAVLRLVNKVRNNDQDLHFDSNIVSIFGDSQIDNELQQLPGLRANLGRIAKHLSGGSF